MDPTSSLDATLTTADRRTLLALVHRSIAYGLEHGQVLVPELAHFSPALAVQRACFVTLHLNAELRGCVGTLQARQALLVEVAHAAYNAAFQDPRFSPVTPAEASELSSHISVLTVPEPLRFEHEADLLGQLQPTVDGIILREGDRSATFLPSVWETLPNPQLFLRQLKRKAGLGAAHWSDTVTVERYRTVSFSDDDS